MFAWRDMMQDQKQSEQSKASTEQQSLEIIELPKEIIFKSITDQSHDHIII